jgi:O-succinylbenzoic acid--CoA ligase
MLMKTFYDLLRALNPNLETDLNKTFIITSEETFNYHSIIQSCSHRAVLLKDLGVEKNSIVPILCNHSLDFIVSVFSLWMLEAIPVPINIKLSLSEVEDQIRFLKCRNIITDNSFKNKLNLTGINEINIGSIEPESESSKINFTYDESRTAVILFTSGSSGKPKAVELSFSNLISSAKIGNEYLKQTPDDHWLASLPFYHIGGFSIIFRALMFGTGIILPADLKTKSLHSCILRKESFGQSFSPSLISLVSIQIQQLIETKIKPSDKLRHVLLGGGSLDSNLMNEALSKGWNVSKVYGSTETASFVTVLSPKEFKLKPESAGKPIPPNEIFIVDENGNDLQANTEGEIAVKSPAVMKGYGNDETATKQKLKNGLYFTGDFGYKDEDGYLYVINRRSDLIVTGGENVNPVEVENIILSFPKVNEVCVFGIDDIKWGQKIVAAIVSESSQKFNLDELKDFLEHKIAPFKIPKEIFFVDELPKTELGKVRLTDVKNLLQLIK